jgi:hypothetical protein
VSSWLADDPLEWGGCPVARSVATTVSRERARITGRVTALRVVRVHATMLEGVLDDGTGSIVLRWAGRDHVAGIERGVALTVEGTVHVERHRAVLLDPLYRIDAPAEP